MQRSGVAPDSGNLRPFSNVRKAFSRAIFSRPKLPRQPRIHPRLRDVCSRAMGNGSGNLLNGLLSAMRVDLDMAAAELARIPTTGPLLVVCNRPFGILDGVALGAVLRLARPDVRILAHFAVENIANPNQESSRSLADHCFCIDPFGGTKTRSANAAALLRCVRWLRDGGALVVFPSTGISRLQFPGRQSAAPDWDLNLARLARLTNSPVLPIYFQNRDSSASQALDLLNPGLVHPRLRSALLLSEFLSQEGNNVSLRIGRAIAAGSVPVLKSNVEATRYLRWRTHLLGQHPSGKANLASFLRPIMLKPGRDRVIRPMALDALVADMKALRPEQILDDSRNFTVFAARAHEISGILPELGRLREVTFREAGEGTGRSTDLDTFDRYYTHIVLWSKQQQEPVGAYRIGKTAEIIPLRGVSGLYTSTLFRFDERFFAKLGPALELGRSFVRPEYQRQYAPLLLLWKGIARYVAAHPETPTLFGAVSISGRYTRASRELIYRFFESRMSCDELRPLVQPRHPFRPGRIRSWDCRSVCHAMKELDEIADPIADMEDDGKSIPILIKHYHRLGGRLLGFNVDPKFSRVLDGLVVMDLRQTQPSSLERYMGKSGLAAFRRYHGLVTLPG